MAGGRGAIGFGINAPFGLAIEFDPDWHGRYDAIEAELKTINGTLVASYGFGHTVEGWCRRPDRSACQTEEERRAQGQRPTSRVFIGGGLDLQYASTVLAAAIPNPFAPGGPTPATDATIRTEGHDSVTAGFNLGLLWITTPTTRVGVHYRSGMSHDIEGTSTFSGLPGPLAALNGAVGAHASVDLPGIATFGGSWRALPKLTILGETEWFDWSRFREVRIEFADGRPDAVRASDYRDAWAFAGGVESPATDRWTLRGGVHYDTTPTVDGLRDTTVPDSARLWLGAGATTRVNDRFSVDLAFNHVFFNGTSIDLTRTFFDGTPLMSTVNIRNDVSSTVTTIAADFRMKF
jgi:long-chain fatty acid transport protein